MLSDCLLLSYYLEVQPPTRATLRILGWALAFSESFSFLCWSSEVTLVLKMSEKVLHMGRLCWDYSPDPKYRFETKENPKVRIV